MKTPKGGRPWLSEILRESERMADLVGARNKAGFILGWVIAASAMTDDEQSEMTDRITEGKAAPNARAQN